MIPVGKCPYRLRISFADKRHYTNDFETFVLSKFPGHTSFTYIDGSMYLGFQHYGAIQQAFTSPCEHFTRRMVDPYALHITISRYHTLKDLDAYFSMYGPVYCIVDHVSSKGRYAFVNFMERDTSLRVLQDGSQHFIKGSRVKIRGKVLSAAEPYAPKPYSPARLHM